MNHHHYGEPLAQISLTLSRYLSLLCITLERSSMLHPVSVQSSCRSVKAGHPTLACSFEGVHKGTSLLSSPILLQQCPACLARLIWMVFEMDGRYPYSCCSVGCCLQDLFNTARSILVQLLECFLCMCLFSVNVVHPYSRSDATAAWKKTVLYFIWQVWLPYDQ